MDQSTQHPPEFLTVSELAELLRIKERKVYDLASSGQVPCSRATGKLLFPEAEIRAWIDARRSGPGDASQRPAIFLGSHDPLLEWAIRQSQCGLATFFDGSVDGVTRFCNGEGIAAGLHIHDAKGDAWNIPKIRSACAGSDTVLIGWAKRTRGLVTRPGPRGTAVSLDTLHGKTIAARQPGSGADLLIRELLTGVGIAMDQVQFTDPMRSEADAVLAVAEGGADVAFGLSALASQYGLDVTPIIEERFDIVVNRKAYFEPAFQRLLAFCQTEAFRTRAAAMTGYDTDCLNEVRWNA